MPEFIQDPQDPNKVTVRFSQEERERLPTLAHRDKPIIRYMSLPKFLSMIVTRSIWFSRPDKFSDEYEGFAVINIEDATAKEIADSFRKMSFINCWNYFRRESFHMWHIYGGPDKYGIGVISTVQNVKDSIQDEYIKSRVEAYTIKYVPAYEIYDGLNGLIVNTRKKEWYDYEEEVRFIDYQGFVQDQTGEAVNIDVNLMIQQVILSPYVDDWFVAVIHDLLEKYGINKDLIIRSELRDSMLNR